MTEQSGELKPIKPERIAEELAKFHALRQTGELRPEVLDQKFARIIQELRERRVDGTREEVKAALKPLVESGAISRGEHDRLLAQLGMG
ncbi:MAG TPA: hypothetical protein VNJ71_13750 [Gemmatimonadales bacterium]|jgi:hypothetical protein|nr:hypothetical protein [Gemmatimonadales bacterium]